MASSVEEIRNDGRTLFIEAGVDRGNNVERIEMDAARLELFKSMS